MFRSQNKISICIRQCIFTLFRIPFRIQSFCLDISTLSLRELWARTPVSLCVSLCMCVCGVFSEFSPVRTCEFVYQHNDIQCAFRLSTARPALHFLVFLCLLLVACFSQLAASIVALQQCYTLGHFSSPSHCVVMCATISHRSAFKFFFSSFSLIFFCLLFLHSTYACIINNPKL